MSVKIPLNWDIRAIIGLGNPGKKYAYNRHNIGFLVADKLVSAAPGRSWVEGSVMHTAEIRVGTNKLIVVKPQTFMNDSGRVIPLLRKQGIEIGQILVVHDELELPFGEVKVKMGGSAKGHNGLRSIIQASGSMEFMRLRCGIGRPDHREAVPDYVLQNFSEPKHDVDWMIITAIVGIENWLINKE